MNATPLTRFLLGLNLDPRRMAAFEADPDAVLAAAELSEDDRSLLRHPEGYRRLQARLGDTVAVPDGPPMPRSPTTPRAVPSA